MKTTKQDGSVNMCSCCEARPVGGQCIVNGQRRMLTKLCRECFIGNINDIDIHRDGKNSIHNRKDGGN
jgi:hypothetical protein